MLTHPCAERSLLERNSYAESYRIRIMTAEFVPCGIDWIGL